LSEIYCLDSNVLITYFKKEPNYEKVRDLFKRSEAGEITVSKELGATFITSDHGEMEQIEEHESIPFLWLPANPKVI